MADLLPNIYSSVVVTLVVAVVALVLRFISRRITKQKVWYDDWLCVVAFVSPCSRFSPPRHAWRKKKRG
jgi:integral membrane sensor domain MASE1